MRFEIGPEHFNPSVTVMRGLKVEDAVQVVKDFAARVEADLPRVYSADGKSWVTDPAVLPGEPRYQARLYGQEDTKADDWIEKKPGKPDVVKGTRIPVAMIQEGLAGGDDVDMLAREFPNVPREALVSMWKQHMKKNPK